MDDIPDGSGTRTSLRANEPIDAARDAAFCWWSGTQPVDLERHPLERRADGMWQPVRDATTGAWYVGLEWDEPRDLRRIVVTFGEDQAVLTRIQYWRHNWPTPAPERHPGARRGWIGQDDPWHGSWTTAQVAMRRDGPTFVATFDPLDLTEVPDHRQLEATEDYATSLRRTLKLRLAIQGTEPAVRAVRAETPGVWRRQDVALTFGCGRGERATWDGRAAAYRGAVLSVRGTEGSSTDTEWRLQCDGDPQSVRLALLRADSPSRADETIVTVRSEQCAFSFSPADVAASGPLFLPDFGVYVAPADGPSYEEYVDRAALLHGRSIYDSVLSQPEQTARRAFAEIPPLQKTKQEPLPRYLPLGWDMNRQEFALLYNADVFCDKRLLKVGGRDTARLLWPGVAIRYRIASGDPPDFREREDAVRQELLDGYLPIVVSTWQDREFLYEQTAFVAPLGGAPPDPLQARGDEDLVLFLRFRVRNRTEGVKRAQLWFATEPCEELVVDGTDVLATGRVTPAAPADRQWRVQPYALPTLRGSFAPGVGGHLRPVPLPSETAPRAIASAALYEVDLPGFAEHAVAVKIPFVSLTSAADRAAVRDLNAAGKLDQAASYWRELIAVGGRITVPDRLINDFYKATAAHVAISVDRDPQSGLFMVPAATYAYGTCANESCLQIRQLDWRGYHNRARAYLETYLKTQGRRALDGRFRSSEGALRGLDVYGEDVRSNFNYNLDHGFIMRQLAEHYWLTGDGDWVRRWASNFVAACDFIAREREATKRTDSSGVMVPEYGLLPAGHLEDNPEWRYWYAVNAWAYGGLRDLAQVLAETGHPEASRLQREADAFRADILASLERARRESPVVRLRDGTAVPHTPTRAGLRGRAWGWFREAAYGPLHLVDNDLLDPRSREVTWILKDLEDNLFVSRQYGWPVDVERDWFSQGGIAVQANLLNNAVAYLRRGQVEHAVRALFNNLAANLYQDVRCFTEHPVIELGHGVGPFYKSPDECGFLNALRQFLVYEEKTTLHLGWGIPRCWLEDGEEVRVERIATRFGPLSYWIRSEVAAGHIRAEIRVPERPVPAEIDLCLRHPEKTPVREIRVEGVEAFRLDPDNDHIVLRPKAGLITVDACYTRSVTRAEGGHRGRQ